jgi:hypothetical protein
MTRNILLQLREDAPLVTRQTMWFTHDGALILPAALRLWTLTSQIDVQEETDQFCGIHDYPSHSCWFLPLGTSEGHSVLEKSICTTRFDVWKKRLRQQDTSLQFSGVPEFVALHGTLMHWKDAAEMWHIQSTDEILNYKITMPVLLVLPILAIWTAEICLQNFWISFWIRTRATYVGYYM